MQFFEKLDESSKIDGSEEGQKSLTDQQKRHLAMVNAFKEQMLVDDARKTSFKTIGQYTIQLMDELGKSGERVPARQHLDRLAALDAGQVRQPGPKPWWKDIKWNEGFLSHIRAFVTVAAIGSLTYLLSDHGATMPFEDQIALVGKMAEGFASARASLSRLAGVITKRATPTTIKIGAWVSRAILAPLGNMCKAIGGWLFGALPRIGRQMIEGIGTLLTKIKNWVTTGVEVAVAGVGKAVNW
jgi:hypothetical protein